MKKSLNCIALLLMGFGSLFFGGCNESPSGNGNGNVHPALIEACSLLSPAEAEAIMGKPVLTTVSDTSQGYITHCGYSGSIDSTFILPTHVDITAVTTAGMQSHLGSSQNVPAYFSGLKANLTVANEVPLTGIGDDAFWYKTSGKLYFYKGDVSVDVIYRPHGTPIVDTSAEARTGSTVAAQDVAARL